MIYQSYKDFFREPERNNQRQWFKNQKEVYEKEAKHSYKYWKRSLRASIPFTRIWKRIL